MSAKGIEATLSNFSTFGFFFKKSTFAAGLISSAPKPKLIEDLVALFTFVALVLEYGTSIHTTSLPSLSAPTVQFGVQV